MTAQIIMDGKARPLTADRYFIGRGDGCDILLPETDMAVSRRHALIERDAQGVWHLLDISSRNGTLVNGQRVPERYALQDGDVIRIGSSEITLQLPRSMPTVFVSAPVAVAPTPGFMPISTETRSVSTVPSDGGTDQFAAVRHSGTACAHASQTPTVTPDPLSAKPAYVTSARSQRESGPYSAPQEPIAQRQQNAVRLQGLHENSSAAINPLALSSNIAQAAAPSGASRSILGTVILLSSFGGYLWSAPKLDAIRSFGGQIVMAFGGPQAAAEANKYQLVYYGSIVGIVVGGIILVIGVLTNMTNRRPSGPA